MCRIKNAFDQDSIADRARTKKGKRRQKAGMTEFLLGVDEECFGIRISDLQYDMGTIFNPIYCDASEQMHRSKHIHEIEIPKRKLKVRKNLECVWTVES